MYFKKKLSALLVAVVVTGNSFSDSANASDNALSLSSDLSLNPELVRDGLRIPLMLATKFQLDLDLEEYYVSEKLDGVRAVWNGHQLHSRSGRIIPAPDWFTKDFPSTPLDGELWIERGAFEQVSGIIRTKQAQKEDWEKVRYMVFDLPNSHDSFTLRLQHLERLVKSANSKQLEFVEQQRVSNSQQLKAIFKCVITQQGEGVMLQHRHNLYSPGRSQRVLKLKPVYDAEATVIGHVPGKGKYQGMTGAIRVRNQQGQVFKIGSGFTDQQRLNPPALGSQITYQYRGKTINDLPRFATFLRVREPE